MLKASPWCYNHSPKNSILFRPPLFPNYLKFAPLLFTLKTYQVFSAIVTLTVLRLLRVLTSPHVREQIFSLVIQKYLYSFRQHLSSCEGRQRKYWLLLSGVTSQYIFFRFSEPVYQSPACSGPSKERSDWLFTENAATHGSTRSADHESNIDAKISQT